MVALTSPIEELDTSFSNDEFINGLEKIATKHGLTLSTYGKEFYEPGITNEGKRERFKKKWKLMKKRKIEFTLEYIGEDIHLEFERGRDLYETTLYDKRNQPVLKTVHIHVNTPDCFSDEGVKPIDKTSLYQDYLVARELFNLMKEYSSRTNLYSEPIIE